MTRVAVLMPVGPGRPEEFVADTAASLAQFLPDARFVVLDDTGTDLGPRLALPNLTVLVNRDRPGLKDRLYLRLSLGFEEVLREPFDLLVRLDDDVMMLGNSFVDRALALFAERPDLGLLGLHYEQYLGDRRSFHWPAGQMKRLLTGREALRDPVRTLRLWQLYLPARRHGYGMGEHVLSAVSLWRPETVRAMQRTGVFGDARLVRSGLEEDHIFGLGARAAGFAMRRFGTGEDDEPLAVAWKGLPAAPGEIVAAGKELVHSTKSYAGRDEAEVREAFRRAREAK